MRSPEETRALLLALGIECNVGDEVYDLVCEYNPTIRAFIAKEITLHEALFIEAYLSNGFNATRAARTAEYAGARANAADRIGHAVLQRDQVRKLIARRVVEKTLNADEILGHWADLAKADMSDFVSVVMANHPLHDEPVAVAVPDLAKAEEMGKLHLIKKVKMDVNGTFTLELRDQDQALNQIARHLGMFEKDNTLNIPKGLVELLNTSPEQRKKNLDEYRAMLEEDE
jgi:phage terminase small subunit